MIQTVLGDRHPDELGPVLVHEHLITLPAPHLRDGGDMVLDREDLAVVELRRFREAGGGAVVDMTTAEMGRDPRALRRISEGAEVSVIMVTGHICEDYWRGVIDIGALSEDDLIRSMVSDLVDGIDGVRAGVIKCGSSRDDVTDAERRVIRAAARVQQETGAPIATHTTAGTMARQQLEILIDAGAVAAKISLGHLDRKLDWSEHLALAAAGPYLAYDCFSKDWYELDADRVAFVHNLIEAGYGRQLLASGDMAKRSYQVAWGGGPGFTHIPWRIVPWLRREGVSDEAIDDLTTANPARFLDWTPLRT